ncbi:hypothetical protein L208DRAFT_1413237 [Tricholoma matsutake]|nr:hypothetical protein L208DRAFT_1413237 [Tricholoma matsutake 945]
MIDVLYIQTSTQLQNQLLHGGTIQPITEKTACNYCNLSVWHASAIHFDYISCELLLI